MIGKFKMNRGCQNGKNAVLIVKNRYFGSLSYIKLLAWKSFLFLIIAVCIQVYLQFMRVCEIFAFKLCISINIEYAPGLEDEHKPHFWQYLVLSKSFVSHSRQNMVQNMKCHYNKVTWE